MSIEPPHIIRKLVSRAREDGIATCCGHCRQPGAKLRCSRCKCVKYLSQECQKAHFTLHKENCKAILQQRVRVVNGMMMCHDPSGGFFTCREMMKTGDLLLATGYKESDTVAHGWLYYQEALSYFLMPMVVFKNRYHHVCSTVEDQVLLLIIASGGDDEAIRSWCSEESSISGDDPNSNDENRILVDKSPRFDYYQDLTEEQKETDEILALGVKYRGLAKDDTIFQIIYLFNQMKALSEYREDVKRLGALKGEISRLNAVSVDVVSNNLLPYLASHNVGGEAGIVKEIQSTVRAIDYFGKMSYLIHLRDTLPFSEEHAPGLFKHNGQLMGRSLGRKFLWMILQDLFFETPGVNSILNEFVSGDIEGGE